MKFIEALYEGIRFGIYVTGLSCLLVLSVIGVSYINGTLVEAKVDIASAVSGPLAFFWPGLLVVHGVTIIVQVITALKSKGKNAPG